MNIEELYAANGELYVDVLEGELDAEFERDLEIWLSRSEVDQARLEKLSQVRQTLKDSDDVAVPESGAYYDNLEARIMSSLDTAIETGEIAERVRPITAPPVAGFFRSRSFASRIGSAFVLAGLACLVVGRWFDAPDVGAVTQTAVAKHAVQAAAPQVLGDTVLSYESDADLALDIAARRLVAYHKEE